MITVAISLVSVVILSWLLRYTISTNRVTRSTTTFSYQRHISSDCSMDIQQVIEKIKLLYLYGRISKITYEEDLIRFEDSHAMNPIWNVYIIKLSSPSVLRYRGFIMQYRINHTNLEEIVFFLSN